MVATLNAVDVTMVRTRTDRRTTTNFLARTVDGCVTGFATNTGFFKKVRCLIGAFTSTCICIRHHIVRTPARRRSITGHVTFGTTHPVATFRVTTIRITALCRRRRRATGVGRRAIITAAIRTSVRAARCLNDATFPAATGFSFFTRRNTNAAHISHVFVHVENQSIGVVCTNIIVIEADIVHGQGLIFIDHIQHKGTNAFRDVIDMNGKDIFVLDPHGHRITMRGHGSEFGEDELSGGHVKELVAVQSRERPNGDIVHGVIGTVLRHCPCETGQSGNGQDADNRQYGEHFNHTSAGLGSYPPRRAPEEFRRGGGKRLRTAGKVARRRSLALTADLREKAPEFDMLESCFPSAGRKGAGVHPADIVFGYRLRRR